MKHRKTELTKTCAAEKQKNALSTFYNFCPKTVNWAKHAADGRLKTLPCVVQARNLAIKSERKRQINQLTEAKLTTNLKQAKYYADKVQLWRMMKRHAICWMKMCSLQKLKPKANLEIAQFKMKRWKEQVENGVKPKIISENRPRSWSQKANFRDNSTKKKIECKRANGWRYWFGDAQNQLCQRKILNLQDSLKKKA